MVYLETDKYIIMDSRQVILDSPSSTLVIPIEFKNVTNRFIKLYFSENTQIENGTLDMRIVDDILEIKCVNFSETLGRFTIEPIKIAVINDKKILIQIWSSLSGADKKVRIVFYTLFMEK